MKKYATLVLCAACSLGGKRPNYQYYVLTSSEGTPAHTSESASQARVLAVDQVNIPGYLDRDEIATRTFGHRLVYSKTDRWAEPLDDAFERALRQALAARLAQRGIQVQAHSSVPTYDLRIEVLRFERSGPDRVELWARWTLSSNGGVLDSDETRMDLAMTGVDTNAMASALSEAIARMATEIAGRVEKADVLATREHRTR